MKVFNLSLVVNYLLRIDSIVSIIVGLVILLVSICSLLLLSGRYEHTIITLCLVLSLGKAIEFFLYKNALVMHKRVCFKELVRGLFYRIHNKSILDSTYCSKKYYNERLKPSVTLDTTGSILHFSINSCSLLKDKQDLIDYSAYWKINELGYWDVPSVIDWKNTLLFINSNVLNHVEHNLKTTPCGSTNIESEERRFTNYSASIQPEKLKCTPCCNSLTALEIALCEGFFCTNMGHYEAEKRGYYSSYNLLDVRNAVLDPSMCSRTTQFDIDWKLHVNSYEVEPRIKKLLYQLNSHELVLGKAISENSESRYLSEKTHILRVNCIMPPQENRTTIVIENCRNGTLLNYHQNKNKLIDKLITDCGLNNQKSTRRRFTGGTPCSGKQNMYNAYTGSTLLKQQAGAIQGKCNSCSESITRSCTGSPIYSSMKSPNEFQLASQDTTDNSLVFTGDSELCVSGLTELRSVVSQFTGKYRPEQSACGFNQLSPYHTNATENSNSLYSVDADIVINLTPPLILKDCHVCPMPEPYNTCSLVCFNLKKLMNDALPCSNSQYVSVTYTELAENHSLYYLLEQRKSLGLNLESEHFDDYKTEIRSAVGNKNTFLTKRFDEYKKSVLANISMDKNIKHNPTSLNVFQGNVVKSNSNILTVKDIVNLLTSFYDIKCPKFTNFAALKLLFPAFSIPLSQLDANGNLQFLSLASGMISHINQTNIVVMPHSFNQEVDQSILRVFIDFDITLEEILYYIGVTNQYTKRNLELIYNAIQKREDLRIDAIKRQKIRDQILLNMPYTYSQYDKTFKLEQLHMKELQSLLIGNDQRLVENTLGKVLIKEKKCSVNDLILDKATLIRYLRSTTFKSCRLAQILNYILLVILTCYTSKRLFANRLAMSAWANSEVVSFSRYNHTFARADYSVKQFLSILIRVNWVFLAISLPTLLFSLMAMTLWFSNRLCRAFIARSTEKKLKNSKVPLYCDVSYSSVNSLIEEKVSRSDPGFSLKCLLKKIYSCVLFFGKFADALKLRKSITVKQELFNDFTLKWILKDLTPSRFNQLHYCSYCGYSLEKNQDVKVLACKHIYHADCSKYLIIRNSENARDNNGRKTGADYNDGLDEVRCCYACKVSYKKTSHALQDLSFLTPNKSHKFIKTLSV